MIGWLRNVISNIEPKPIKEPKIIETNIENIVTKNESLFVSGKLYRRKELHGKYGGQQQAGISTPANYPFISLFSSETGSHYGYKDGWQTVDTYYYTGQGQEGDMQFTRGNKAIRDHIQNNKEIHLFESKKDGFVKYVGEMLCHGHHYQTAPDFSGNMRKVIVLELK